MSQLKTLGREKEGEFPLSLLFYSIQALTRQDKMLVILYQSIHLV